MTVANLTKSVATQAMPQTAQFRAASAMTYGQLAYISGYNATNGKFVATLADADAAGRTPQWVALGSIASGSVGTFAALDQSIVGILDTSGGAVGDPVYLSTTAGNLTLTAPSGAARQTVVGYVTVVSATIGAVQLLPANNVIDKELSSVDFQGPANFTSASATALTVGRLGATTPAFTVDASAGTSTAGLKVVAAALNGTVALVVTDTSGNTNLTINALGSGTIGIGTVSTGLVTIGAASQFNGNQAITGTQTVTSASASSIAIGRLGATTPAFSVDSSAATQTAGLKVTGAALNGTVALVVTDTSGNTNLSINALGSGTITIGNVSTGNLVIGTALRSSNAITSSSPSAGIGYATGAGTAQTQSGSKSTTVAANALTGAITLNGASLAGDTSVSFTFTNTSIATGDAILIMHESGGTLGAYSFAALAGSGTSTISVHNNTAGALSEALVLRFVIIKSVNA